MPGKKSFETKAITFLKKEYAIKEKIQSKDKKDLRSELFFLNKLLYGNLYLLTPKNEINHKPDFNIPFCNFTIYYYSDTSSPKIVIRSIDSLSKKYFKEGFYGPFGKDHNLFFSVNNIVVHLERSCNISSQYWNKLKENILLIAAKDFKGIGRVIDKPCE